MDFTEHIWIPTAIQSAGWFVGSPSSNRELPTFMLGIQNAQLTTWNCLCFFLTLSKHIFLMHFFMQTDLQKPAQWDSCRYLAYFCFTVSKLFSSPSSYYVAKGWESQTSGNLSVWNILQPKYVLQQRTYVRDLILLSGIVVCEVIIACWLCLSLQK